MVALSSFGQTGKGRVMILKDTVLALLVSCNSENYNCSDTTHHHQTCDNLFIHPNWSSG